MHTIRAVRSLYYGNRLYSGHFIRIREAALDTAAVFMYNTHCQGESVNTGLDYWTTGLDFDLKKYGFPDCQSLGNGHKLLTQHG